MRYPGGKNGGGLYQQIICQMPPHSIYVEPFLGSGAVLRMKRPAERSFGIDLDPGAVGNLAALVPDSVHLLSDDGIAWLDRQQNRCLSQASTLVYCDPPYLATKSPQRYRHKMDAAAHRRLLGVIRRLPCHVLISGYGHPLYDDLLAGWRRLEFPAWTRRGPATEVLWCNFPEPEALHDYRYLGRDKRERLDIKRQQARWRRKLEAMDRLKRLALLSVLAELGELPGSGGRTAAADPDGILAAGRSSGGRLAAGIHG